MPDRDPNLPDGAPTSSEIGKSDTRRGAGDLAETATAGGDPPLPSSARRLGDFELLRELGRGGMGVVYEARQVSLKRRVALKVLPPAMGLSPQAKQRFEREAQAAAKLHHTNIVPVHAIGEHDGHHFYAMDLIEGQSLDRVLRDVAAQGSNPLLDATVTLALSELTNQPTPEYAPAPVTSSNGRGVTGSLGDTSAGSRPWFDAVARLIAEVADGLDYAHGRGVIHRDVKPGNLMLSSEGRLCITDFGLARIVQEPGMTVSGSMIGTPAYMSPEQIAAGRMKLDHRTDVYSLGAVLYEMLTLRRPFPGDSREEVIGAIMSKDPRAPRKLNRKIPQDLETICLKALEKEPDRRYATAGALAEDLRQYLQHGLIAAKRASLPRRAWKAVRRHPVASTVTVGIVAVALLGGLAWQLWVGRSTERAGRLMAAAETDLRDGTYRQGLEKIEQALAIDPDLPGAQRTRGRLLFEENSDRRELVRVARELVEADPDDREAHAWLAFEGAYKKDLGDVDVDAHLAAVERGAPDTAEAWYARGIAARSNAQRISCFDHVLDLDPGNAMALIWRSEAKRNLHDTAGAIADAQAGIAARPRSTRGRRFLAAVYTWDLRDFDRALEEYDKAAEIDPDDPFVYKERSWVFQPGHLDDRERWLEDRNRAVELAPGNPHLLEDRSLALNAMGRSEEALVDARQAVAIDPNEHKGWLRLCWALLRLQRTDELREAMGQWQDLAESWPNRLAASASFSYLADLHRRLGEHGSAVTAAERAIELDPENLDGYAQRMYALAAQHGKTAIEQDCDRLAALELSEPEPLRKRAGLMKSCGRPEAALADYAAAIELAPQWADPYYDRGNFRYNRGEYAEALPDYDAAIERAPEWKDPHRLRGRALAKLKRHDEALASISRAIELSPNSADAIYTRAQIYFDLERYDDALTDLERCFELTGGSGNNGLWLQARALQRLGRDEEALEAVDRMIADDPSSDGSHRRKAFLLFTMGRVEEAVEAARAAVELAPGSAWNQLWLVVPQLFAGTDCVDAAAQLERALSLAPDDEGFKSDVASVHAWILHPLCPDRYDPVLALRLASEAAHSHADDPDRQYNLASVLYREGRFAEAREACRRSVELERPRVAGSRLLLLAMIEQRLGRPAEARRVYEEADERIRQLGQQREPDVLLQRREAAELLGIP